MRTCPLNRRPLRYQNGYGALLVQTSKTVDGGALEPVDDAAPARNRRPGRRVRSGRQRPPGEGRDGGRDGKQAGLVADSRDVRLGAREHDQEVRTPAKAVV